MQLIGQIIVTIAVLITLIGPTAVDWNDSHVFNPKWPPHARFHAIVYLCMTIGFSLIALWLIWRASTDHVADMLIAALVPIISWGSFFIAVRVRGSAAEDDPGSLPRMMGMPVNLFNAGVFTVLSLLGFLLYYLGP